MIKVQVRSNLREPSKRHELPAKERFKFVEWVTAVLRTPMPKVDAKGKIFLIRLFLIYGDERFGGAVRPLAQDLRVSDEVVEHALDVLTTAGVIEKYKPPYTGRRGIRKLYGVSPEWLAKIREQKRSIAQPIEPKLLSTLGRVFNIPVLLNARTIASLRMLKPHQTHLRKRPSKAVFVPHNTQGWMLRLEPVRYQAIRPNPIGLSPSAQLLLAVLLVHADYFGIVTQMPLSQLTQLTGITRHRLRAQLRDFQARGHLRLAVLDYAGEDSPFSNAAGAYFLNLAHADFAVSGFIQSVHYVRGRFGFSVDVNLAQFTRDERHYISQLLNIDGQDDHKQAKDDTSLELNKLPHEHRHLQHMLSVDALQQVFQGKSEVYLQFFLTQVDVAGRMLVKTNKQFERVEKLNALKSYLNSPFVSQQTIDVFTACSWLRANVVSEFEGSDSALRLLPFHPLPPSPNQEVFRYLALSRDVL